MKPSTYSRFNAVRMRFFTPIMLSTASAAAFISAETVPSHSHDGNVCSAQDSWIQFSSESVASKRNELLNRKINCKSKVKIDTQEDLDKYLQMLNGWNVTIDDDGKRHLVRMFNVQTMTEISDICRYDVHYVIHRLLQNHKYIVLHSV